MTDFSALASDINALRATETRSLVHHLDEAKPYLSASDMRVWKRVKELTHESEQHERRLVELLLAHELPVEPVTFSQNVAFFHFMTVASVLPVLIGEKTGQIAAYERAISRAGGAVDILTELQALLLENQKQLAELQELRSRVPTAVAGYKP